MEQFDTLLHLSSETETVLRSINNFFVYFLLWTGGLQTQQPSFISMNQLCGHDVHDTGIAKYTIANIPHRNVPHDFSNYRDQYLQGYWEVKDAEDYVAVSLKTAYPISSTTKLNGVNENWCYLTKYRRYTDSKEFYFIQLSQVFKGYLNINSYKAISELLQYIKIHYPGLYIIVGDFNVQGHEKVFEHFLGLANYHICPLYKTATCNDNEGVASPDGLVVSKELYQRVEYAVDFYPGYSYQHFILSAKLYEKSLKPGTFDVTDFRFANFLKVLQTNYGDRDMYIKNKGIFSPKNEDMIGTPTNIREIEISSGGPKTIVAANVMNYKSAMSYGNIAVVSEEQHERNSISNSSNVID